MNKLLLDVEAAYYHAAEGLSKSALDQFRKSPAHYRAWLTQKREPTEAMRIGTLVHRATFEPKKFTMTTVVAPVVDRRTKDGKYVWEEFQASNAGKDILKADDLTIITGVQESIRDHSICRSILSNGVAEASAFAFDDEHQIQLKARFDWINDDVILDLKTTEDASPQGFARSMANYRYHIQAAHYLWCAKKVGQTAKRFIFAAVEKSNPFAIALYELSEADLFMAEEERQQQLRMFSQCKRFDNWPSYSSQIETINLPKWAKSE